MTMTIARFWKSSLRALLVLITITPLLTALGCSIYRNDRCYVDNLRYSAMRQTFMQTGSVELVRQQMERLQWARCEKNEVLYRISKEFEVPSD